MAAAATADQSKRVYVGYYPSWSDTWFSAAGLSDDALLAASKLARVPAVYTHVVVAFAQPNFAYAKGASAWTGTGINFNAMPADIKAAIALLHKRNMKVMLAVGGATYNDWDSLAAEAGNGGPITTSLTNILTDIGFDGLDVDYEVAGNNPVNNARYVGAVRAMRKAVNDAGVSADGTHRLLALAGWSTGADCVAGGGSDGACGGKISYWGDSAGRERAVFTPKLALMVDMVNVMSYDARYEHFDAVKGWQLYRNLFPSSTIVSIGLETSPEGWAGGMLVTKDADAQCTGSVILADQFGNSVNRPYSVERLATRAGVQTTHSNPRDGAMLWQILKPASGTCGAAALASPGSIGAEISKLYGLPADTKRAAWQ